MNRKYGVLGLRDRADCGSGLRQALDRALDHPLGIHRLVGVRVGTPVALPRHVLPGDPLELADQQRVGADTRPPCAERQGIAPAGQPGLEGFSCCSIRSSRSSSSVPDAA